MTKGTGSLEKRDQDGFRWRLVISAGYHKGKKVRYTKTVKVKGQTPASRKKAAEKELALFLAEIEKGTYLEPSKFTVEDFASQWLTNYAEKQLADRTIQSYKQILKARILPALGHIKLQELRPLHLTKFYNNLHEPGVRDDKKEGTLSPSTIRKCHAVLSSMLEKAVKWQLIPFNPASKVDPPKQLRNEMQCLDEHTAAIMLEELDREPLRYRTLVKLAIVTGLRRGELMALQWKYVDLEKGVVQVRHSVQYVPGQGMTIKEPKNKSSLRSVSIPESLVTLLKEYRKEQLENRLKAGNLWHDSDFVFTQDDGQLMHVDTITKWFPLFLKKYNKKIENDKTIPESEKDRLYLPIINFHSLRHTAATLLIDRGLNVKAVSNRLGHAQTSTTINIYTHALQSADRQAADLMEDIFNKQNNKINQQA